MTQLLEAPCDRDRVAILFNPASGSEDGAARRAVLEERARAAGLTGELVETDPEHGAAPLAQAAIEHGVERLLVAGGDGSVCEAAGALAGTETALAVLPGGTGNLLAANLGLPTEGEAALHLALTGGARPMDVGRANGTVFLIMAGMGLDARMIRDADRKLKDRLGVLAYFVSAVRNLRHPPTRYTITIDGRGFRRRAQTVLVANLGRITGGLELVPGANAEDGLLDVAILHAPSLWELARLGWRTVLGQGRGDPSLELHRGRNVRIETGSPQPVQLDGNEADTTARLEVSIEPGALRLVRPSAATAEDVAAAAPVVTLVRAGRAIGWSLLAGGSAAALLHFRAQAPRGRGERPNWVLRHPVLSGLAGGAALFYFIRTTEGAGTPQSPADAAAPPANGGT